MPASTDTSTSASKLQVLSYLGIVIVAMLCLGLIGGVGYAKYKLDQSEAALAAPEEALSRSDDLANKISVSLGYGGYLGAAQNYLAHKDSQSLADMKLALNTSNEAIHRLGDQAPAAVRHDLAGIVALFQSFQDKATQNPDNLVVTDILPLASALPMLEARLQAAQAQNKITAQNQLKAWSSLLTLAAWSGLALALAMAVGFTLALRSRQTVPLKTLAQSVEHMTKGDMQTPVWGLERDDAIGEVARAIDMARYRFSQMPDVTVMTDQGPMRLKFEGEAKSMFEALTASMLQDHQKTHHIATGLTESLTKQKDLLISLVGRLNASLGEIQQNSMGSESALRNMTHTISESAKYNQDLQKRMIDQIGKLVPYLQDRARGMAEMTTMTGEQVGQTLQRLNAIESTLSGATTRSTQMIQQVAESANQMGERLFSSLNILQASNNVLSETSDAMRTRFNEAVETLGRGETTLQRVLGRAEERLSQTVNAEEKMASLAERTENSATQIDQTVRTITDRNKDLSDQISLVSQRMDSILASFDGAQHSMGDAIQQIRRDGGQLSSLLKDLRDHNDQLLSSVTQNSQTNYASIQNLTEKAQTLLGRLEIQISQQAQTVEGRIDSIASQGGVVAQQVQATTAALAQIVSALRMEQDKFMTMRASLSENLDGLGARMESQVTASFSRTERLANENYTKLSTLLDQMDQVMQRLGILGQLTGTLGTVAGQLGQMVPALVGSASAASGGAALAPIMVPDEKTQALLQNLHQDMDQAWHTILDKIETLAQTSQNSETPAPAVLDFDTKALLDQISTMLEKPWAEVSQKLERLAQFEKSDGEPLSADVDVDALAGKLKDDMQQQWHDMIVQIEGMNDQLAQMVVQQKDQLETRLIVMDKKLKSLPEAPAAVLQEPAHDASQQTAIMNEIVAALANLNDHVEDLDSAVEALQQEDKDSKSA